MSLSEKFPYLPLTNSIPRTAPDNFNGRPSRWVCVGKIATVVILSVLLILQIFHKEVLQPRFMLAPPLGFPEKIQRRWGQYSPYFPAGGYVAPPEGCAITQVNIVSVLSFTAGHHTDRMQLQRHGARYPNAKDDYHVAVKHLLHAHEYLDAKLYFLQHYSYELESNVLIAFGAEQYVSEICSVYLPC